MPAGGTTRGLWRPTWNEPCGRCGTAGRRAGRTSPHEPSTAAGGRDPGPPVDAGHPRNEPVPDVAGGLRLRPQLVALRVIFLGIIIAALFHYCTTSGKKIWSKILDHIPFVGKAIWQHHMCQALQALALLINSGVSLVAALKIVSESVEYTMVKLQLIALHDEVASGQLLSNAMTVASVFLPEVIALIHIGEESGTLGQSLEGAALVYNDILEESLKRFVFFLQPVVIIVLGLLVGTLIFAVYLPIMQLSHAL